MRNIRHELTKNLILYILIVFGFFTAINTQAQAPEPCSNQEIQLGISIICDLYPSPVWSGSVVEMTGVGLTGNVQIFNLNGTPTNISGAISNNGELVTFTVPLNTPPGDYSVSNTGITGTAITTRILTISSFIPDPVLGGTFGPGPQSVPTPAATDFQDLISSAFNYSVILVGIAVFIMIMWGGFLWLTSAANPSNISRAKGIILNAILGAVLLVSAYVILYTINPELVGGTFTLKGIPAPASVSGQAVVRLVATNELGAASAITEGCIIATEIRDLTAVECPFDVATATGLPLDPVIEIQDSNANQQVNATVIQNNGNLGAGRRIVVLDTGYNYNHPELSSSYGGGKDFINNDNDPMDDHGSGTGAPAHGSHVAGIITADGIDARARGVAPQVQIIAGKILNNEGKGFWSNMVEAIYWAVNGPDGNFGTADDFRADAINISMGGGLYNSICDNTDETTKLLAKAIQYAKDNGVLTIIAAGNNSGGVSLPGCVDAALTVSAINSSNNITGFSGRGSPVDIAAPGVNIYSSLLGSNYDTKSGTSMATPVVSGVAALIKAANPNLTAYELEQRIISTACDLGTAGKDNLYGWGRINASPGSCASPPPPPPTPGATGRIWVSPASCTKNTVPTNQNCDTVVNYIANGLTAPASLLVGKNGFLLQTVQCPGSACNGQITDSNPKAGGHKYSLQLSGGSLLGSTNGYIYTTGTIGANFSSCSKTTNPANPNCDVVLTISTSGISPDPVVIKRDGINWRIVQCPTSSCNIVTDADPSLGIHTYTLHNSADDSRLGRVTVTIIGQGTPATGTSFATLCSGLNYTGTCEQFSSSDLDLTNNAIGDNTTLSMRGYATLCTNPGLSGVCETFMADDPDLSNNFIGSGTVSSLRRGLTGGGQVTLCSGINLGGVCETFSAEDPDLSNNLIGNDTVSSLRLDSTDFNLCSDVNYGGLCQYFLEGIYPDLRYHPIGDDQASSFRSL